MLVSNETVYNTADIEKIFDYTIINSTSRGGAVPRSVEFLNIIYSHGKVVAGVYLLRDRRLDIALPRKSAIAGNVSPLENIASAMVDSPCEESVGDEDYCFIAPAFIRRRLIVKFLDLLIRRTKISKIDASGIPLRYTNRLRRGQLQAQRLGSYRHMIARAQREIDRQKDRIAEKQKEEQDAMKWFEKRGIDPIC